MTSLAEIALDHARQRLAGRPVAALQNRGNPGIKTPTSAVQKINMPTGAPVSTGFVAPCPLDRHLFLEGRAWALELARTLRVYPIPFVAERLAGATAGKPPSYAAGVQSVIKVLQENSHASH